MLKGPVRAAGVVDGERAGQGLQLGESRGLGLLCRQPSFEGLLEPLDFALGLRLTGLAVLLDHAEAAHLLDHAEAAQFVLQGIAAALTPGEAGGEHQAVIGQGGGRDAIGCAASAERFQHDRAGDRLVRRDPEGIPGVVIQPGQDLGITSVGQRPVREAGLPALVGLAGLEPQAGGLRPFARSGTAGRFSVMTAVMTSR